MFFVHGIDSIFTFGHFQDICGLISLIFVLQQGRVFDETGPLGRILGKLSLWQGQRLGQEPERHGWEERDESCNEVPQPPGAHPACISWRDADALWENEHTHACQQQEYRCWRLSGAHHMFRIFGPSRRMKQTVGINKTMILRQT